MKASSLKLMAYISIATEDNGVCAYPYRRKSQNYRRLHIIPFPVKSPVISRLRAR